MLANSLLFQIKLYVFGKIFGGTIWIFIFNFKNENLIMKCLIFQQLFFAYTSFEMEIIDFLA
jgi:hypothetical protein